LALVVSQIVSCVFLPRTSLDHNPPTYASSEAGNTGVHYHAQLFVVVEMGRGLSTFCLA
jgi:hypothetical protein